MTTTLHPQPLSLTPSPSPATAAAIARVWQLALDACDGDERRAILFIGAAYHLIRHQEESNSHATL